MKTSYELPEIREQQKQELKYGDPNTINRVRRVSYHILNRYNFPLAWKEDVAEDIVTECWEDVESYNPERAKFITWVSQKARSYTLSWLRKMKNAQGQKVTPEMRIEEEKETESERGDRRRDIERMMNLVNPNEREVIRMENVYGLTHQQIAGSVGKSINTIKNQIKRGKIKIRDEVARQVA